MVNEVGFGVGEVSPCHDFVFVALKTRVKPKSVHMEEEVQSQGGQPGPEDGEVLRVLSRSIKWASDGMIYESDDRHADGIIVEPELAPNKSVVTPIIGESPKAKKDEVHAPDGAVARGSDLVPVPGKAVRAEEGSARGPATRSRAAPATRPTALRN